MLDRRSYVVLMLWAAAFVGTLVLAIHGTGWVNRCEAIFGDPITICEQRERGPTPPPTPAPKVNAGAQQLIGIAIEFVGTTLSVIGLNGQKWALMKTKDVPTPGSERGIGKKKPFVLLRAFAWLRQNWMWAAFFGVFALGQITISVALNYGTQALLTTITALSVVTNAIIAKIVFNEPFAWTPRHRGCGGCGRKRGGSGGAAEERCIFTGWGGGACIMIIIGVGACAVSAPPPPTDLLLDEERGCPSTDVFRSYWEGAGFVVWFYLLLGVVCFCLLRIFFHVTDETEKMHRKASYRLTIAGPPPNLGYWALRRSRLDHIMHNRAYLYVRSLLAVLPCAFSFFYLLPPSSSSCCNKTTRYGVLCAMVGTLSITFSKPAVTLVHHLGAGKGCLAMHGLPNEFVGASYIVFMFATAGANLVFLNLGMRDNDPNVVYPLYSVLNTVFTAVTGTLLYRTYVGWPWYWALTFLGGFALTMVGLYFLVSHRADDEEHAEFDRERHNTLEGAANGLNAADKLGLGDEGGVEMSSCGLPAVASHVSVLQGAKHLSAGEEGVTAAGTMRKQMTNPAFDDVDFESANGGQGDPSLGTE